ncbi:hypothetical protein [Campylobacter concisus]|uniref:hypothetical protein n=1 Tax=Campylobacter concisus TaxID=199 RepID=UPI000CD9C07E|nr:hypothetical protein [Campylobacter concisus]
MDDLMDRLGFYFWVIIVGFVGGVLSIAGGNAKIASDGKAIINFFVGTISSTFICWVAYETAFYFTEKSSFSLAVGGFFAWRGTAWVSAVIDKTIQKKIDNFGDSNYDYTPRPPRDYDDIGDEK